MRTSRKLAHALLALIVVGCFATFALATSPPTAGDQQNLAGIPIAAPDHVGTLTAEETPVLTAGYTAGFTNTNFAFNYTVTSPPEENQSVTLKKARANANLVFKNVLPDETGFTDSAGVLINGYAGGVHLHGTGGFTTGANPAMAIAMNMTNVVGVSNNQLNI